MGTCIVSCFVSQPTYWRSVKQPAVEFSMFCNSRAFAVETPPSLNILSEKKACTKILKGYYIKGTSYRVEILLTSFPGEVEFARKVATNSSRIVYETL